MGIKRCKKLLNYEIHKGKKMTDFDSTIKIMRKDDYGKERFYPQNRLAQTLLDIMPRRNCFLRRDIEKLHEAGFKILFIQEHIDLGEKDESCV